MKTQSEDPVKLPEELISEIGEYLNLSEQYEFLFLNKQHYQLFLPGYRASLANKFLGYVAEGNQLLAEKLLERFPEFLMHRGMIRDLSGRIFPNITAFKYACWALDTRYMCGMMLKCLHDLARKDEGKTVILEKIWLDLLKQYEQHENEGVHYLLNGEVYQEKHFNFQPLITSLKSYGQNRQAANYHMGLCDDKKEWCLAVGKEQRLIPAHVAQHYCNSEASFLSPSFKTATFLRSFKFIFCEKGNKIDALWFSPPNSEEELGVSFAIARSAYPEAKGGSSAADLAARKDSEALKTLAQVRTNDYDAIKDCLLLPFQKPDHDSILCLDLFSTWMY